METGKSRLTNKVAGIIVTGEPDDAEHIIVNLANFFIALGLTIPPFGTLTVLCQDLQRKAIKIKKRS